MTAPPTVMGLPLYFFNYEEAPLDWSMGGREYFALKIKGDSMSPEYMDGDVKGFPARCLQGRVFIQTIFLLGPGSTGSSPG